jgi:hypothetical protein
MKYLFTAIALVGLAVSIHAAEKHQGHVRFGEVSVPGVSVMATQGDKTLRAVTDDEGNYILPDVDGTWAIQVEMPGFETLRRNVVVAKESAVEDWVLKLKPLAEINGETSRGFARESISTVPTLQLSQPSPEAAKGLLVNGSVSNGAATNLGLVRGFGNNRRQAAFPYRGSVTINASNALFDARSFSLTGQDTARPNYNRLNSTVVVQGPFQIPGLFRKGQISATYSRAQNRNASVQTALMPTAAERAGDFSASAKAPTDPATGMPFSNGVIPQDRISAQARGLVGLFPLPNFTSTRYNYQVPVVGVTHGDNLQIGISGLRFGAETLTLGSTIASARSDNPDLLGFTDTSNNKSISGTANWVHRFTPRLVANVRYSFSRNVSETVPFFGNRIDISGNAGVTGADRDPRNWGPPGLSFSSGITRLSSGSYANNRTQSQTLGYTSTIVVGRHALGYGVDHQWQQYNLLAQSNARGNFTFTGDLTGNDFADFLLGVPTASSLAFGNADKYFRQSTSNAYLSDDFHIFAKVTVNAGLRWEYESPITEKYGRLVNLQTAADFSSATPVVAGSKRNSLVRPHRSLIQPKIGLTWRPWTNRSMAVRLGYGIYQDTNVYRAIADQMAQQAPLSKSLSVQNTPSNPLTLADGFRGSPAVTATTFAIDPDFRPGTAQNWSINISQNLPSLMQMTVTYLGIKGTHVPQRFLPNTFPVGGVSACAGCPVGFTYLTSNGNTNRHSGSIEIRRRQRSGWELGGMYTYAKAIDDAGLGGGNYIAQNWLDFRAERGLSSFDQRHQFTAQGQFTSGMFLDSDFFENGLKGLLLKNWTMSSQLTIGSGTPITPVILAPVKGTGVTGSIRPNVTGAPIYLKSGGAFLNPAAFVAPAPGEWGNAARNSITGPGQFTLNAALARGFHLTERINMDLRVTATNVLNHVTFASWNTTVNSAQFGVPTRANSMRTIQPSVVVRW